WIRLRIGSYSGSDHSQVGSMLASLRINRTLKIPGRVFGDAPNRARWFLKGRSRWLLIGPCPKLFHASTRSLGSARANRRDDNAREQSQQCERDDQGDGRASKRDLNRALDAPYAARRQTSRYSKRNSKPSRADNHHANRQRPYRRSRSRRPRL